MAVLALIGLTGSLTLMPRSAVAASTPVACSAQVSESAASAVAMACGGQVEVTTARTEFSRVTAQPSGDLVRESAVVPQWARRSDGSWADIDLHLAAGADGKLRPAASVADVRFSPGGTGPLVTLTRAGRTMSMSWPSSLPVPQVSTDSATYANVYPDVDLVVRATLTGFTHVLVVKTAAAAADPRIAQIRFGLGGDATVKAGADGSLRMTANGKVLAWSHRPVMWDSSTGLAEGTDVLSSYGTPAATDTSGESESSPVGPGDGAQVKPVAATVDASGALVLTPTPALLDAAKAVFPVFVDPAWDVLAAKWAYANNADSAWNMEEPEGSPGDADAKQARVGKNQSSGDLYRTVLEFPITDNGVSLKGKQIKAATVRAGLDHTESCSNYPVYLWSTNTMIAAKDSYGVYRSSWANAKLNAPHAGITYLTSISTAANETSCGQADKVLNFSGSNVRLNVDWSVNSTTRTAYTVVLAAAETAAGGNESVQARWKRLHINNFWLIVTYNTPPTVPTFRKVVDGANAQSCPTGPTPALTVTTLTPSIQAVVNDKDADAQTVTFEWSPVTYDAGSSPLYASVTTVTLTGKPSNTAADGQTPNASPVSTALSGLVDEKEYAFRVWSTDPDAKVSPASAWCHFKPSLAVPPAPTVTSPTGTGYCPKGQQTQVGPGEKCSFRFQLSYPGVSAFKYWWDGQSEQSVPTSDGDEALDLTVPRYGRNLLTVRAIGAAGKLGATTTFDFLAKRPSPAVASWGLETYPRVNRAAALADRANTFGDTDGSGPLANDTPLTASNVELPDAPLPSSSAKDARIIDGYSATFNGSTSSATTTMPVVDTTKSFAVAAWVRLGSPGAPLPTSGKVAVTQEGGRVGSFNLGYWGGPQRWTFWMHGQDLDGTANIGSALASSIVPVSGQWTHLAASYDAASGKATIYVNGKVAGSTTLSASPQWTTNQTVAIGREKWNGNLAAFWPGAIADVRMFNRSLVSDDFTGKLKTAENSGGVDEPGVLEPIRVAGWDFESAGSCYDHNLVPCEAPEDPDGFGRRLSLTAGTSAEPADAYGDGLGLGLDGTHWTDDQSDEWYGRATNEYGTSQRVVRNSDGSVVTDAEGNPVWENGPVLRTDHSFTVSAWVRLAEGGADRVIVGQGGSAHKAPFFLLYDLQSDKWAITSTSAGNTDTPAWQPVFSEQTAEAGVWTHLTAVYDAAAGSLRLYVNGVPQGNGRTSVVSWHSNGPLHVGNMLGGTSLDMPWRGDIDRLRMHVGAMTDTQVALHYAAVSF